LLGGHQTFNSALTTNSNFQFREQHRGLEHRTRYFVEGNFGWYRGTSMNYQQWSTVFATASEATQMKLLGGARRGQLFGFSAALFYSAARAAANAFGAAQPPPASGGFPMPPELAALGARAKPSKNLRAGRQRGVRRERDQAWWGKTARPTTAKIRFRLPVQGNPNSGLAEAGGEPRHAPKRPSAIPRAPV